MSVTTAPADLYRHGLQLLLDKNIPAWTDLWDEDGILEFPFAPDGWPKRLEGKAAVAEYMRGYPDHIDLHDFPSVEIHQTVVPETIVVEMRAVGRLVETDGPFEMTYIAVVTVRNGLITGYRDYWNPLAVQDPATDFAGSNR
ncbi:nuclear transport factor 2 family protein [Streptomyces sp. SID13666]|uniref:nuclear transport factor 2 family protein n=1 Tax=unclassified Streptomyces TaxID=2593676 RepID=UPI0013C1E205|nr:MULTISPECIES: nuclear transport factor 2 family protein [unclassified Streptomyces]NEA56207.1 nuclear transport factor 2 family protein [Streptomyces sp. SID13666]NEA71878.1 nuclear transport factor 2 family protein [Streptomyces sp. SID13588]